MKKRVSFTVDVEAQPQRAAKDHINRLIWGKTGGEDLGLDLMMSLADKRNIRLTLFLDYAERELYGEELLDVGREIARRGHDLQVHQHADYFSDAFLAKHRLSRVLDLCVADTAHCKAYVGYLLESHARVSSLPPVAYRGGGYRLGPPLLKILGRNGFLLDASYNPLKRRYLMGQALRAPFFWSNGLFEVPVPGLSNVLGFYRGDYNFNAPYLYGKNVSDCVRRHKVFLKEFFRRFGEHAVAPLVLHSWSFFQKDDRGHFSIPLPEAAARFEGLLAELGQEYAFITLGDLANNLEQEKIIAKPETVKIERVSSPYSAGGGRGSFSALGQVFGWTAKPASFLKKWWNKARGRLEYLNRPAEEAMFRAGAHAHLNPRTDDLRLFAVENAEEKNEPSDRKALKLALKMRRILSFQDDCSIRAVKKAKPSVPFFTPWPRNVRMPFAEISFKYMHPYMEADFVQAGRPGGSDIYLEAMLKGVLAFHEEFSFWEHRNRLPEHVCYEIWEADATGERSATLTYLLKRKPSELLWRMALDHYLFLAADANYKSHHNHGFFQICALMLFCRIFPQVRGASTILKVAENRLETMLRERVSAEGIFKEHSVSYHLAFLLWHLNLSSHFPLSPECGALVAGCVRNMARRGHDFLLPGASPAPLGDSFRGKTSPFLRDVLKNHPPEPQSRPFYFAGGYGFMRGFGQGRQKEEEDSCVIFCGAFHSQAHKHCDDLHFVWNEGPESLLTEAGYYVYSAPAPKNDPLRKKGFWYADPKRCYVESAHAHNVVEMDGESYSRLAAPYGALSMTGGWASEQAAYLTAEWQRPENYAQRRVLVLHPRRWLLVLDSLRPQDRAKANHLFSQWFQLDPAARLLEDNSHRLFAIGGAKMFCHDFSGALSSLHRGEKKPRLLGWHAEKGNSLVPSWSLGYHQRGTEANFAALFSLDTPCKALLFNHSEEGLRLKLSFDEGREESLLLPGIPWPTIATPS